MLADTSSPRRFEAMHTTWPFGLPTRESVVIHIHHLSVLSPLRLNQPGTNVLGAQAFWCRGTNGCRIDPVGFRERQPGSIPARAPASTNLNRQTERLQHLI